MRGGPPPGSDLPAPYEDPWRRLGADLRALLASLRLRLWELGRRNRQGDLWRPVFWPQRGAAWFWPLLLALAVGLLVLVGVGLARRGELEGAGDPGGGGSGSGGLPPAPQAIASRPPSVETASPETASPETAAPQSVPPETLARDSVAHAAEPPMPLAGLSDTPGAELLVEAAADPARALLQLRVTPAFGQLSEPLRRERLEGWWQRAQELGYERLELRESGEGLLARSALVGRGLVLYEPPAAGPGDPA